MTHKEYESKSQMKRVEILKAREKQMTHDELLAKLSPARYIIKDEVVAQLNALRAIVELHKPDPDSCPCCGPVLDVCGFEYPCPTIQAIEKELS